MVEEKAMRCSKDLRRRVIAYVQAGGKKTEAAKHFGVGEASVYRWMKCGEVAQKPGPRSSHKIVDGSLQGLLEKRPDAMLKELAKELHVDPSTVWYAMRRLKISRKKNVAV
jgi:putative transposase